MIHSEPYICSNTTLKILGKLNPAYMTMIIVYLKEKPVATEWYLRALGTAVLLFKIAYDIIHLLSGWVI